MDLKFLFHFGKYLKMMSKVFRKPENFKMYWIETFRQMNDIGVGSLPIVVLISVFIGMVTAVQFAYQLDGNLIPRYYIGYVVRDISIIELAPTITSLVLAGKVGSNMAAEIGGMRQKEHIDAMEIMGVNTIGYLLLPRIIAALTMIPLLVCLASFISIIGGYISSVPSGLIPSADYIRGVRSFFVPYNVFMMLVKAFVFSYILTTISCYQGYYVKSGSIELGKASTQAVVYSDIVILLADYVIALLLTNA
jgi:phospholipid/cholesterol/gamma-HCH transport system permease protein